MVSVRDAEVDPKKIDFSSENDTSETESESDDQPVSTDSGDSACEDGDTDDLPPRRSAMVVMTCVISGYTLIGPLQHALKHALKIQDTGMLNEYFTQSVAFVQWGKTFSTIGQNVFLSCFPTKHRVYIAMAMMFVGTLIPPLFVFALGSHWIMWVPMCYGLVGLALGVFEATFLSVISPLGPLTKSWAIMGFPAAFAIVNIFGLSLEALFDMPVSVIFWHIVLCQPVAIMVFRYLAPKEKVEGKSYKQSSIRGSLRDWRTWLLRVLPFCLVNTMSHFVMESVLPAVFNTYNAMDVAIWGPTDTTWFMKKTWFLVILSISMAIGDMSSRKLGYHINLESTRAFYKALFAALCLCCIGLFLVTQGHAYSTWIAVFLAFFGAGFNYAIASRYIDRMVPRKHNLAAYSVWMFVGYMGAIAGATMVTIVRDVICGGQSYEHQCL